MTKATHCDGTTALNVESTALCDETTTLNGDSTVMYCYYNTFLLNKDVMSNSPRSMMKAPWSVKKPPLSTTKAARYVTKTLRSMTKSSCAVTKLTHSMTKTPFLLFLPKVTQRMTSATHCDENITLYDESTALRFFFFFFFCFFFRGGGVFLFFAFLTKPPCFTSETS